MWQAMTPCLLPGAREGRADAPGTSGVKIKVSHI
jgi:hypothetical protein